MAIKIGQWGEGRAGGGGFYAVDSLGAVVGYFGVLAEMGGVLARQGSDADRSTVCMCYIPCVLGTVRQS